MDEAVTSSDSPLLCHRLLSKTEHERWPLVAKCRPHSDLVASQPLSVAAGPSGVVQYPAFQYYASLDREMFVVLRATFRADGRSDLDLWNFLRTAQKALGGMTAAEHLIGHHSVEVAQLSKRDRDEVLLELAHEELWRLQQ
jgi:hypothetical protein